MADDIQSNIRINVDTTSAMDSIRLLQNQISAFHQQMSKMGAASAADSRNMQQNLINSINSTGQFAANITKIKTTAEQFSYSLEKNKLTMGEYFRYAGGATKTFGKLFSAEFETINKVARERVKDLQSQYIKLGRDANGAMQAIKVRPLTLDMENLGTKTQIAAQRQQLLNQLLKQGSTNLLNFGKNTQWAGRQLMVGFTVPLSIMGGAAMKAYKEIEEASLRLKRVYGDFGTTAQETEKMVKQVQALALEYTKYGIAVKDSMEVAATAAATGKKGADLLAQISSANRLSALGGIDQQKALQTTISLTDAFSISAKDLGKNINFLNAVENQTVLSIDDLTTAIPKAAPVIQQLGGDVKDLAFFLTAMKEGGINASEGANAIKSGLASIINPTNTASKMLQGFGINLRGIVQANKGDVKKTVVDFAQALDKLDPINRAKAIEQLFGKFQFARMSTLFKNVIEQGSQASEVLKLANQSSLQLSILAQRELGKIEQSPLYKFQKAIADFQAQLAPVGEQFMKAVTPIINFGTDVLKNFNSLGDGVKGFIVQFVAVAGVIGPVLLMSFGLIANAVANVIKGFALVKDIFNKTGKSSMSLGDQVNYMTREQIQAAAIASSLDQVHSKLKQTFTSEAAAVDALTAAYQRSVTAQQAFNVPVTPRTSKGPVRKYAAGGIIRGPGTGTSDSILAMLSNGEAVIPAASVARNPEMVRQLVSGNIPGFQDGLVPAYTNAVALLKDQTNQALKTGVSGTSLASEMREIGPGMNSPIVEAIAKSLGAKNNKQIVGMLRDNPDLRSFAESIQIGVAKEMDAIGSTKIKDPELSKIYQTVARKEAASRGQLFAEQTEKFFTTPTTFEDTTTTRQRSDGRIMSVGRAGLFKGLSSYRSKNYRPIAEELGTNPTGLVKAHMSDRTFISLKEATTRFGLELSNQAKAAADRMANGIVRASQSIRPRMQQAEAAVAKGMAEEGQMRSPSRVTKQKGAQLVQGAVQGIQEGVDDARRAGSQLGQAAAQGVSQSGRVSGKGGNRVSSDGNLVFIPGQGYLSEGQLARDEALANAPMQGPKQGTRLQRLKAGMNPDAAYRRIQATSTDDLSTSIRNKSFGAGGALAIGSMFVPGEAGQIMGIASLLSSFAGMGSGGIAKGLKSLSPNVLKIGFQVAKKLPYIGIALTAFELFDTLVLPGIRKNADAFNAISDTLNITKDKIDKINNFFGTELKLTGVRTTEIVTGSQTSKQATIAKQFQESQEFKDTYQESAQKMKGLSDAEFKAAMQALSMDLYGQGADEELAKTIIDAIALEAGKSSVSIAPKLFSIANPETKSLLSKNLKDVFALVAEGAEGISPEGTLDPTGRVLQAAKGEFDNYYFNPVDPESTAKIKAGTAEIASYMSALSGQFQNGTITAEELVIEYDKILEMSQKQPGTSGIEALKGAFVSLNAEIGNALTKLNEIQFGIVSEAIIAGVTPTQDSLDAMEYGSEAMKQAQAELFTAGLDKIKKNDKERIRLQNQLSSIQKQNNNIANTEQKINDKYDRRIAQIEKIKKLNDQITKSQQGQLTLAEALNRGDVSAAAAAAIDIQQNDVQNALERQKDGLEEARKAETAPLDAAQEANTTAVDNLTARINKLNTDGIKVTVETATGADKIITPKDVIDQLNLPDWLKGPAGFIITKELIDVIGSMFGIKTNPNNSSGGGALAAGGHITGPGTGTSDDIPAMLSNGEYVIRANAVKTIGVNTLDKLNQADRLGFAAGGMVNSFKKKKPKPPKPKPYTLEDLAKPITRKDDPDWYDYTNDFFDEGGIPFASPYTWTDANQGFYRGQSPSNTNNVRDILDVKDGKVFFTSVAGAIKYYKALILSRRQAPKYISKILGDKQWTGLGDKQQMARSNSIYNRMYGNYNGLDKAEAKVLASAMTRLWGKDSVKPGFKTLGLSSDLLTNKRMFKDWDVPGQQAWDKYTRNNDEFIPPLLPANTPKYAEGGFVGPRPAPQWDEKGRWVVSRGESYWSTAESTLPGGMTIGPWWSTILKSNIDPETGKERRLYRNSRIWIPGSKEPYPPKIGIPRTINEKKPLYIGGMPFRGIGENHLGFMGVGGFGMMKMYADGGLVGCPCGTPGCPGCSKGYAMGGMVGYKDGGPAKPNPAYEAYLEMRKAQKNNGWLESMISHFEGDTAENKAATKWHILRGDRFVTRKIRPGGDTSKVWIDKDGYILNRRDTGRYNPFGFGESRIKNYKDNLISEYDKKGIWQEKRAKFNYNMRVSPFANGGLVGYKNGGKAKKSKGYPAAFNVTSGVGQQQAERNRLYKQGGFQGFEAGANSFGADLMNGPLGGLFKGMGKTIEGNPALNFLLSTLSLPVNLIGGASKGAMNAGKAVAKGDLLGAATAGFRGIGDAFASTYGNIFDKENTYKSQFEVIAENAISDNLFGAKNNKEMAALARIIGGTADLAADPLNYVGVGLASKAVKAGSLSSKIANPIKKATQANQNKKIESAFNKVVEQMSLERGRQFTPEEIETMGVRRAVETEIPRQEGFNKVIKNPAIITRRSVDSVIDMLRTNKTKTLGDTGSSAGGNDIQLRRQLEHEYLGGDYHADDMIYGYLADKGLLKRPLLKPKKPVNFDGGTDFYTPFSQMTQHYGPVGIVMKNSSIGNATLTKGDSLNSYLDSRRIQTIPFKGKKTTNPFSPLDAALNPARYPEYMEAQFLKYSPRQDIEALYVQNKQHLDALRAVVKELGLKIPVRLYNNKPVVQDFLERIKNAKKEKIRQRQEQEAIDSFSNGGMVGKYAGGGMVKAAGGGIMINGQITGGYSMGGMVPKVFAEGGYAMGTDTVPAMLTPGEFVIKKSAVDRIGPSALNKINGYAQGGLVGGTSALMSAESGNPVYNNTYEINVNVRSESNPDQIARTVLTKINQINNHRIRGV